MQITDTLAATGDVAIRQAVLDFLSGSARKDPARSSLWDGVENLDVVMHNLEAFGDQILQAEAVSLLEQHHEYVQCFAVISRPDLTGRVACFKTAECFGMRSSQPKHELQPGYRRSSAEDLLN